MHLLIAMLVTRFLFVEAGQSAVMPLVQLPVLDLGDPKPVAGFQRQMQRLDRAGLIRSEGICRLNAFVLHQHASSRCLCHALFRQIDIPPAGKAVFQVPLALAMADENQFGHFNSNLRGAICASCALLQEPGR